MAQYYDRYSTFKVNGDMKPVPGITIPKSDSDKVAIYKQGLSRLDKLSNLYYLNPYSGWLIMLANPQAGSIEFEIPDNFMLRIPFPLIGSLQDYKRAVELYKLYYGEQ